MNELPVFDYEIPCDYRDHDSSEIHDGPARYYILFDHECTKNLEKKVYAICAPFANAMEKDIEVGRIMWCGDCTETGLITDFFRFVGKIGS